MTGKLSDAIRRDIVQRLACFDTPSEIAAAVKEEYGIVITRQSVETYDPEKRPKIAKEWRELHAATRKAFLAETAKEPVAHRAVRIRRLSRMVDKAEKNKNYVLAKDLLEQIAKEVGEAYTNRRVLASADPMAELARELGFTVDQLKAALLDDGPAGMAVMG